MSREEVQTYITKTMKQYEYDLAGRGISMDVLDTQEGLKILVLGEVDDKESLRVLQSFFGSPYTNPDLPVPMVWKVDIKQK